MLHFGFKFKNTENKIILYNMKITSGCRHS